jgi:hypothetical protein
VNHHHPSNDWYEELCALAAIGEVSPSEFEELQRHLAECSDCSQLYGDFRRITSHDLGLMAASKRTDETDEAADPDPLDERELLSRLLERAKREREPRDTAATPRLPDREQPRLRERGLRLMLWLQRPTLSYGSLALILSILAAIGAYRLREAQLMPALEGLTSQLQHWKGQVETTEAEEKSTSQSLQQVQSEREGLRRSLADAQTKYTELQNQEKQLEVELAAARAQVTQEAQDLEAAKAGANGKEQQLAQLQSKLQDAMQRSQEQERIADDLRSRLQGTEQAANTQEPESQGFSDADAKQLFGARDLHIVDVYDVDTDGKTRRSYGRVYYVEKKLLVFYAFDLEDKKRNRTAAGFQAWGYREANEAKPESLGLFNVDDPSINRWVLKVSNPRVLERIEAVYVTLEPPNGSPSPRGRRLLYANLVVPPNHP